MRPVSIPRPRAYGVETARATACYTLQIMTKSKVACFGFAPSPFHAFAFNSPWPLASHARAAFIKLLTLEGQREVILFSALARSFANFKARTAAAATRWLVKLIAVHNTLPGQR